MKNFKLLLATTAILSAGLAMGARAETTPNPSDITATVKAKVQLAQPLTVTSDADSAIDFGTVVWTGGKTVTVTSAGKIDYSHSDAKILSNNSVGSAKVYLQSPSIGALAFNMDWPITMSEEEQAAATAQVLSNINTAQTWVIPDIPLTAKYGTADSVSCGTVSNFTTQLIGMDKQDTNAQAVIGIGGKLTLNDMPNNMPSVYLSRGISCEGEVTATVLMNGDINPDALGVFDQLPD